jgi:hypothetical protein
MFATVEYGKNTWKRHKDVLEKITYHPAFCHLSCLDIMAYQ